MAACRAASLLAGHSPASKLLAFCLLYPHTLRIVYYLPNVLSVSVISSVGTYFFSPYTGIVNGFLNSVGILKPSQEILWFERTPLAWFVVISVTVWWTVGFSMLLSTVCIFAFIGSWNNYLWPLLCAISESLFTLPIGIPMFFAAYSVDYVRPLTACMIASLPMVIIYIIFERRIVAGITSGAIKG